MSGLGSADALSDKENYMDLEAPPAKRRSMPGSTSRRQELMAFAKGAITRVRMHNFMTYNDATFEPGPRLNLVLGPNGTGKSSLVCALCLGLAGATKLLGRGDNPKEFIQRGKKEAWVEVSLSRGDGTEVVVRRGLKLEVDPQDNKTKAKSEWRINNAPKLMKDVTELMTQLNIQLDNLCQFLPQDKVVEFARLSPNELLAETQKAIGDAGLHLLHQDLIRRRGEIKEVAQGTDVKRRRLEKLQAEQARQQHEAERLQRRAALLDEVELLRKRLLMLEFDEAKAQHNDVKKLFTEADTLLRRQRFNMQQQEGPLSELQAEEKKLRTSIRAMQNTIKSLETDSKNADAQANRLDELLNKKVAEIDGLQQQSDERKRNIADAERLLRQAREAAAQIPQQQPADKVAEFRQLQQQITALHNEEMELDMRAHAKDSDARTYQDQYHTLDRRLKQISDVTNHRLRYLEQRHRGVTQAHNWVRENRARFRGQVFGPVAAHVQVANQLHSEYLNMTVPQWVWSAFVVTTKEDEMLLGQEFKAHGWTGLSRICYQSSDYQTPFTHPNGEPSTMAHLGITASLAQVIEAPMVVAKAIDDQCGLTMAYIGSQHTTDVMDQVEALGLRTVYTPGMRFSFTRSKYNNAATSSRQENLRGPCLALQGQVDERQVADLQAQMGAADEASKAAMAESQALREKVAALRGQLNELEGRKQAISNENSVRVNKLKQLGSSITRHTVALRALQEEPEPLDRKPQLQEELKDLAVQIFQKHKAISQALKSQWIKVRDVAVAEICVGELQGLIAQARAASADMQKALDKTEESHRTLTNRLSAAKAEVQRLKAKMEEKGLRDPELYAKVQAMQGDKEAVEAKATAKLAEAGAIAEGDPSVVKKYQERAQRIAELEAEVGDEEGELARRQAEIDDIKARWLPDLQAMVEKIHTTFSRNFEEMGCAGEVALVEHEDFDKYAIQIRVKFRASEELQVLTAHRQSGGERSVSTILYLIALQNVTVTPFRVVDEINQGMDPQNERKVYTQLVEASTKPGTPQCFLLTPKLLPELPYTENITVLEIFNGREISRSLDITDMDALMFGTRHQQIAA